MYVKSAKICSIILHAITRIRMGAVKRSKLEESEPTISYEAFVEELDVCDSFTTSILDILVKVSVR